MKIKTKDGKPLKPSSFENDLQQRPPIKWGDKQADRDKRQAELKAIVDKAKGDANPPRH